MEAKVVSWWEKLKIKEQKTLITMLYNMGIEQFEEHGIFINTKGDYIHKETKNG